MSDIRTQILAMLSLNKPLTFAEIVENIDTSMLPERRSVTGQLLGPHGSVMEVLESLKASEVVAECLTGAGFTYVLALGGWRTEKVA